MRAILSHRESCVLTCCATRRTSPIMCYRTIQGNSVEAMWNDIHPVFRKQFVLNSEVNGNHVPRSGFIGGKYFRNICIDVKTSFMKVASIVSHKQSDWYDDYCRDDSDSQFVDSR